jgi:hypothetical protein
VVEVRTGMEVSSVGEVRPEELPREKGAVHVDRRW